MLAPNRSPRDARIAAAEKDIVRLRIERENLLIDRAVSRAAHARNWTDPALAPRLVERRGISPDGSGVIEALEKVEASHASLAFGHPASDGGSPAGMTPRQPAKSAVPASGGFQRRPDWQADPYYAELVEMGRGGKM